MTSFTDPARIGCDGSKTGQSWIREVPSPNPFRTCRTITLQMLLKTSHATNQTNHANNATDPE